MTNISLFFRNLPFHLGKNRQIYILLILLCNGLTLHAQTLISGSVVDKENEPIPGVALFVKSTSSGTVTDIDGSFSLTTAEQLPFTLTVSFLGYRSEEIDVYDANSPIHITLTENQNFLDEVVVVGYSTAKKSDYTGSVAVVGARELEKIEITSVGKALQGAVPGLQSISSAGQPGSDAVLLVRGVGSVNASTSPLFVVDGVPGANPNQISGKDIQSISILKDATASALYGSRGANGVVVITTKSGSLNAKPVVNVSTSIGFTSRAVKDYSYLTANQYYELQWEAIRNTRLDQGDDPALAAQYASNYLVDGALKVNIYGPQYPTPVGVDGKLAAGAVPLWNDDWGKAISRLGVRQQYDASISGGSAHTRYFLSGGYLREEGWIRTAEFERFHFRTNLHSKVNSWLEAGANASFSSSYQRSPSQSDSSTGNFANFQRLISNIYPVYERNPDGSYILDEAGNKKWDYGIWRPTTAVSGVNILGNAEHALSGSNTETALVSTNAQISIAPGLKWRSTASLDYRTSSAHSYSHSYYSTGVISEGAGNASRSAARTLNYTLNSFVDYSFTAGRNHAFNLLAGPEIYVNHTSSLSGNRTGFQVLGKTEPSAGAIIGNFNGTSDNYRLASWLSKLDYNLLERYHFSASFRRDGSSRFSKQSRWGNFWSVGASWNLKKEDFLQDARKIDNLNLRFSYGAQGNDNVGNYAYGGFYSIYNSLDMLGLLPSELPTPELKWETNLNFNLGVDISLFQNRLIAQIDLYNRQSKDLLFERPLSPSTGYSGINANVGSLSNRGIDGQITGTPFRSDDFSWDIILNFGHYTNKITHLPQKEILTGSIGQYGNTKKMVEGGSVFDFYIKEWAGVNPENGKATWYKDVTDEAGNITGRTVTENQTEATPYFQGSALPDLYGGLGNHLRYKNLELSFMFSYSIGGKIFDGDQPMIMHLGYAPGRNWSAEALSRWTPENRETDFPRLSYVSDSWNTIPSTRFLYNATYARLKNIDLTYSLPKRLLRNASLSELRLRATGENLLTFYRHKGLDPEQTVSGSTFYRYPAQKTISFGIQASF